MIVNVFALVGAVAAAFFPANLNTITAPGMEGNGEHSDGSDVPAGGIRGGGVRSARVPAWRRRPG